MSLRRRASLDARHILENQKDFGWEIKVTDPDENSEIFYGQSGDVHLLYDTGDGSQFLNRVIHLSLSIASLTEKGFAVPGLVSESEKPWVIEFTDTELNQYKFTVAEPRIDRTLGIVTVILEFLKEEV